MRPHPRRLLPLLLVALLGLPVLAGCMDEPAQDGGNGDGDNGDGRDRLWQNPYDFAIGFDGWEAYDLALRQMYEDPDNHQGPRYRIPGSNTTAQVAAELHAELDPAMRAMGGLASLSHFDGALYYQLDLTPVKNSLCAADHPARERVRGLTFINVVGRSDPERIGLIISAHYDSKRHADASGVAAEHRDEPILAGDDGAASAAAVVELARAFAADPPGIPLTFVLFDGEDGFAQDDCHPLAGSLHYAQSLSEDEKATVLGQINLDMIGNTSATFYRESYSKKYTSPQGTVDSSWLGDAVWNTAKAMEVEAFVDQNTHQILDDHVPFLHEGIPALDIIRYDGSFAPYWHTPRDDHTAIQPAGIDRSGAVVEAAVRLLAATDLA